MKHGGIPAVHMSTYLLNTDEKLTPTIVFGTRCNIMFLII